MWFSPMLGVGIVRSSVVFKFRDQHISELTERRERKWLCKQIGDLVLCWGLNELSDAVLDHVLKKRHFGDIMSRPVV